MVAVSSAARSAGADTVGEEIAILSERYDGASLHAQESDATAASEQRALDRADRRLSALRVRIAARYTRAVVSLSGVFGPDLVGAVRPA